VVFAVVLVGNSVYYALGLPATGHDLGLAVALFTLAEHRDLRQSFSGYLFVVAEMLIMKVLAVGPCCSRAPWFLLSHLWVFFGAAWLWGRYQRVRAQRFRETLDRARHDQHQAAVAATRAERSRIARELHDVIAHQLSLMVIQARS
jgi:signal transduction histidine kinase